MSQKNELDSPLELSGKDFQNLLDSVGAELGSHLDSLPDQPSWSTEDAEQVIRQFDLRIGDQRQDFNQLIQFLFQSAIPCSFNTASPGYLAYIPGGGLPQAAIADLIAAVTNRYMGVWAAAPCLATIEQQVIRWLCNLFGLPARSGGILTSGGSLANWSAMVTARNRLLGEEFLDGVLYCSDQAHHCVEKAAKLCGIKRGNIRMIATDKQCRIDVGQLARAISEDQSAGLRPFFVVANGGSTNTGAVDPIVEIADLCDQYGIWLHVDAAYGGFFALTERGRGILQGIERADSIVVDPHKGLFLPYGTGALLVRNVDDLRETHRVDADYLPEYQDNQDRTDFHEISPELSRDFRGLRIWLPLKMYGVQVFRDCLDEKLDLIDWIYSRLQGWSESEAKIEVVAEPQLSVLAFRVHFSANPGELNDLNQTLLDRINQRKRVYLTSTLLDGSFVIRICVLSFRTHLCQMQQCFRDITEEILKLESELQASR